MKANTVVVGTGSGNVSVTNMNGLSAGDIIAIKPGTYTSITLSNLNNVAVINNGGLVTIAGRMYVGSLTNVTIAGNGAAGMTYGFAFVNTNVSITLQSKCSGLRLYNMDNTSVGEFFDCSANGLATYNGNASTKMLLNTAIANVRLTSSGLFLQGSYSLTTDFHNVIDSIAVFNIIINNTTSSGQELAGASIYHLDAHDWSVVGPCPNGKTDVGIIQINGNARVHNIYRNGGYGYIMRIINVGLDGVAESYLYNCIDLNSWQYGTIDTRVDPTALTSGTTPPYCTGGNIHVLNNTSGNKTQADNYTTVMVVIGSFTGYKCEIRNNLSFNTFQIQSNKMVQMNASDPLPDTSNNQYYTSAQIGNVLVDQTNCFLLPNSPAIDKGYYSSFVTTDIAGIARPQGAAYDIGAREYASGASTNKPPVANAGTNQTITLPTNTVNLDGSASADPDGTIASYSWTQTSGPSNASITTSNAAKTAVTGLAKGTYVFTLTVTDNSGAPSSATVTIIVNSAANVPPVANAGTNQTITLPTNTVSLNGSASSDPDGTIASYSWVKTSGPSSGTVATPTAGTTVVNGLGQGTYVFTLTVTDNSGATSTATVTVIVNSAANQSPVANAGTNQAINLPTSSVSLNGSGSYDPDGTVASYSWAQTSGPSTSTLTAAGSATTIANGLVQGTYVYTLTVTDNSGATSTATVSITVSSAANKLPVADAGNPQSITLPANSVTLDGSASFDPDGTIASYSWAKTSGPAQGSVNNSTSAKPTVTGLVQGTYVFTLTVTDNSGATATATVTITVNSAANQQPIADAGNPQSITLPANSVTLNGSASSDPDGTIASYSWVKTSGPSESLNNATAAKPTVTGMVQGTYVFTLTVTDNQGATASDQVTITVNAAANQPPVANPGNNMTITLPTNSVTLNGTGSSDPDGTIASYNWIQLSGVPSSITTPGGSTTTVTGLAAGTYVYQLTVTDNQGATATAQVKVIVIPAAATPTPVANAGANQTIQLPANSVTLNGGASQDFNGTISSYAWAQVSGPPQGSINTPGSVTTTISGLTQAGVYTFQLVITDAGGLTSADNVTVTVLAAANQAPLSVPGANQSITLPTNSVTLNGSASSDPDGTIASYSWIQLSGVPSSITTPGGSTTTVTGLAAGTYVYELTVTDNQGATGTAQVKVTVNAAANQSPVSNPGSNQNITLPANSVTLNGSASYDPDGSIASYSWIQLSGVPSTITSPTASTTTVTGLAAGTYAYELIVTDNQGATATTQVKVFVNAATNLAPIASVSSQSITLPNNTITLDGNGSYDPDGSIVTYTWVQLSGVPTTITSPGASTTTVTGVGAGQYVFRLTVTDNDGATGSAQVIVNVSAAANQPPIAVANSLSVYLPQASLTIDGSQSYDPDGTIASYNWTKLSGPAGGTIADPSAATTSITNLAKGQYVYQLVVTDNHGATGTTQIIVVLLAANQSPIANAGSNKIITLPVSSVNLDGSRSYDPDGTIASYSWAQTSGPAGATIVSPAAATTTVNNLVPGTYVFTITVTDNSGATSAANVTVTVNAVNQPPVANAGPNQAITLPTSSANLDGSQSYDSDGSIVTYSWQKISGPGSITITNSNTANPMVYGLQAGTYVFELTVTDNDGATATSQVTITVNAGASTPVAMAGSDTTIAAPMTTAMLNGSGSYEAGGSIATYEWQEVTGPTTASISSTNSASTSVGGLSNPGQYVFLLTVTDSKGATDTSSVMINVVNTQRTYLEDQLIIYPNPATDLINIRLISDTTGNVAYRIFDITGRLLYTKLSSKQAPELDSQMIISSLTKGTYFLQAIIGSDRITSKFIKQ